MIEIVIVSAISVTGGACAVLLLLWGTLYHANRRRKLSEQLIARANRLWQANKELDAKLKQIQSDMESLVASKVAAEKSLLEQQQQQLEEYRKEQYKEIEGERVRNEALIQNQRRDFELHRRQQLAEIQAEHQNNIASLQNERQDFELYRNQKLEDIQARHQRNELALQIRVEEKERELREQIAAFDEERARVQSLLQSQETTLRQRLAEIEDREKKLHTNVIRYEDLRNENGTLKQELLRLHVHFNKLSVDRDLQEKRQTELADRSDALAKRYLRETVKLVIDSVGPNNYTACKQKLVAVIEAVREIGYAVSSAEEKDLLSDLKAEFEKAVRAALEREEQAHIKAQIREEQRLEREIEREREQIERERQAIQKALDKALAETEDQHTQEIEALRARLADAEQRAQRNISMAQQTRAGNVYVISNIGSFGEGVYKIGMTRRLEPMERVYELGSASVPFPFDVHMMISCKDAPALENRLHRELHTFRINKANPRKEFFKTDIQAIVKIVEDHHGRVEYVADPEALEYRQTMAMPEEDAEFIEMVYDKSSEGDRLMVDD